MYGIYLPWRSLNEKLWAEARDDDTNGDGVITEAEMEGVLLHRFDADGKQGLLGFHLFFHGLFVCMCVCVKVFWAVACYSYSNDQLRISDDSNVSGLDKQVFYVVFFLSFYFEINSKRHVTVMNIKQIM